MPDIDKMPLCDQVELYMRLGGSIYRSFLAETPIHEYGDISSLDFSALETSVMSFDY